MNVKEIIEQAVVLAGLGRKNEIKDELWTLAKDRLNSIYETSYNLFPWDNIKVFNLSVTITDGIVVLPQYVDIIRGARINNRVLFPHHEILINNWAPALFADSGAAHNYVYLPNHPVQVQPAAASAITLVSSSVADAGSAFPVHIEGTVAGVDDEEEINLNGIIPVVTTKAFADIRAIVKPLTTGRITVSAGINTLGTIAPWDTWGNYKRIQLVPLEDVETTVTLQCTRRFERLVSDNDGLIIPEIDGAIIDMLVGELYEAEKDLQRAQHFRIKGEGLLMVLAKKINENQDRDWRAVPNGMFGDLGEYDHFRHDDISITGINS
jgi:hypothetical protein